MSRQFIKRRSDANQKEIVDALRKVGVAVLDTSGAGSGLPDLIVNSRYGMVLIEIKFGKEAKIKRSQIELMSQWAGYVGVARNFEEAERLAKEPHVWALTNAQKLRLKQFLVRWSEKQLHLPTFYEVIK